MADPLALLWRGMRLACTQVWQSEEFEGHGADRSSAHSA